MDSCLWVLASGFRAWDTWFETPFAWTPGFAIAFVHHNGVESDQDGSYSNEAEAKLIFYILVLIIAQRSVRPKDVGVITPYRKQKELLQKKFPDYIQQGMMVETVDKAQGSEKKMIIYVTVRTNERNALGFVKDYRRLNVSITRAMRGCIVFVDAITLNMGDVDNCWKHFFMYVIET